MLAKILNILVALLLLLVVLGSLEGANWRIAEGEIAGVPQIADVMYINYVFPFEVIALLLLAALIGSIFLAKKEAP